MIGGAESIFIAEIALLLLVGRGLGEVMQRLGQPAVIGQLLAGLILGPSLFGWIWPHAHDVIFPKSPEQKSLISGLSSMGVLMLLLLTGMETDLKLVRKVGAPAITVTAAGVAVPFLCGFALGEFLPDSILPDPGHRLIAALFLGTALSISSIKIVAMVVREMNFMRRNLGQIIVASAIMEDTVGWVIISITLGIAGAGGVALGSLAEAVIGTALFLVFSYTIGRRLVFWLIRWVNDTFVSDYAVVTAILVVMCGMALITQAIGVNTVLGAFLAGVLVGESPILSRHIEDELRGFITAFMMPIFFGLSASRPISPSSGIRASRCSPPGWWRSRASEIRRRAERRPRQRLVAPGIPCPRLRHERAGQYRGHRRHHRPRHGCADPEPLHHDRDHGCHYHHGDAADAALGASPTADEQGGEERARARGARRHGLRQPLRALLIAADESRNGRFASRLAGFIAGQRGMPITVLQLREGKRPDDGEKLREAAIEGAKEARHAVAEEKGEEHPEKVSIDVSKPQAKQVEEAIAEEAEKGYDVLFVGVEKMRNADGTFSSNVDHAAAGFNGPLVLTIAAAAAPMPA